jgi:hypothetical protein
VGAMRAELIADMNKEIIMSKERKTELHSIPISWRAISFN